MALALVEHLVDGTADLLAEKLILDLSEPRLGVDLLDQVAQFGVLADRRLQGQRLAPTHLRQVVDLVDRRVERLRELLARGLTAHGLRELEPRAVELPQVGRGCGPAAGSTASDRRSPG